MHLHVFHAGGVHYSDPFYELEGTEDEENARLRDTFPPGGPKVTYVYDFGADWVQEITRQKMITLEPGQDYPGVRRVRRQLPGGISVRGRAGGTGTVRPGRGQHRIRQDSPLLII